jgi:hypothetical protein
MRTFNLHNQKPILKTTERAKQEFAFYRDTPIDMIGNQIGVVEKADTDGRTAIECWFAKDTHGKTLPCSEPDVLSKVTRSKQSVNLQVKLWAEDVADGMILRQTELSEYTYGWPEWVFRATMEQAGKIAMKCVGYVPRFARAEYIFGNLWFPEMDRFDPII